MIGRIRINQWIQLMRQILSEHWAELLQTVICKEGKNQFIGAMTAVLHWLRQKSSIKIKFLNLSM